MKFFSALVCFISISTVSLAQQFEFDSINYKSLEIGTITIKSNTWVIHVGNGAYAEDFMPVNLPEKYMVEGQDIVFEGAIGRIPMHIKLAGTPVRLTMIRTLYKTKPNGNNTEQVVTEQTSPAFDSTAYIRNGRGKIILIGDTYLIEYMQDGDMRRYVPDYLPEDFKHENLDITFSGVVGEIDPNVRMMGAPLTVKELMLVEDFAFNAQDVQEPLKPYFPFDSIGYLSGAKGVVLKMGNDPDVFIIQVDNGRNTSTNYLPVILPADFKKEGIAVSISGAIGKIPSNVRLMGTPLTIHEISLSEE